MDKEQLIEKIVSNLEKHNYVGTDASIEISLFEYGLVCSKNPNDEGEYYFIYSIGEDLFDHNWMSHNQINEIINEEWFKKDEFFSFLGITTQDDIDDYFMNTPIIMKVFDALQYHGYENIFGSAYYPLDLQKLSEFNFKS